FRPLQAAMLCLVANAASGAFGAIGIPVGVVDTLNLPGHVEAMGVSQTSTLTLAIINFFIPFLLIFIVDGFKGIKETLPSILVVSVTYTVLQGLLTVFNGPELADIIPSLASMLALALFSKKFQPKNIFRVQKDVKPEAPKKLKGKEVLFAWSPFIILTVIVMIWSAPSFKALFAPKGKLSALVANFDLPGTFSNISHKPITLSLNLIGQTGTAILITIIITVLMAKKVNFGDAGRLFVEAFKELWLPIITICFILAI
ncbi:L-lactate permease, partial [Ralstonia insidiosa]|nr:L-lactate permease [Ralstonia insidiosa]